MKNIYYLTMLVVTLFVAACTHEEEDLFSQSSANRADAMVEENWKLLVSAPNGWLMQYYPGYRQEYGGYNLMLEFKEDGKVNVASEIAVNKISSLFSVKQSAGVVLSFDTYNENFHFFADPANSFGSGNGYGLEGDYDFLIVEASEEKVLIKGKKTGGIAVLTPMKQSWEDHMVQLAKMEDATSYYKKYQLNLNNQEVPVIVSFRTLNLTYAVDGVDKTQMIPYSITENGFKLYEPAEINGVTLSEFKFETSSGVLVETNNPAITLKPVTLPLSELFTISDWYIDYNTMGSLGKIYFDACINGSLVPSGFEIAYAFMGSSLFGSYGFNFDCSGYTGQLGFDYTRVNDDVIKLEFNFSGQKYGVTFHNSFGFAYLLFPFGYSSERYFKLTTDDPIKPSYITLTEVAAESHTPINNNVITLHASNTLRRYPFKN